MPSVYLEINWFFLIIDCVRPLQKSRTSDNILDVAAVNPGSFAVERDKSGAAAGKSHRVKDGLFLTGNPSFAFIVRKPRVFQKYEQRIRRGTLATGDALRDTSSFVQSHLSSRPNGT